MDNFVAFDVETANNSPTSICAVGAVKVMDGVVVDDFYQLVRPYPNFYFRHFTEQIHGIDRSMTDSEPTFYEVWPRLRAFIGDLPLVAHNKRFDEHCLRSTLQYYGLVDPDYRFYCTLEAAKRTLPRHLVGSYSLDSLADFMGIIFTNHHNALADAEACAQLALVLL